MSTVPSLIGATWLYLLVALRPWSATIDPGRLKETNPVVQPSHALALIAFALVFAVVTHPLQFVLTQLMEGYWGLSRPSVALAHRRALVQARRRSTAVRASVNARPPTSMPRLPPLPEAESASLTREALTADEALRQALIASASDAVLASYPLTPVNILPTRLGNVLRRYESRGGQSIGLPLLEWTTYIGMVADSSHTTYVQDQRQGLDLAVRMTGVSLFCSVLTVAAMWPHGLWLLLALGPYAAAWLSYRGSLAAAHSYGQACEAWLYLNRFELYKRLHLELPATAVAERALGGRLRQMVGAVPMFVEDYQHPSNTPGTSARGLKNRASRSTSVGARRLKRS